MTDRELLRQLVRTHSIKTIGQEIGWTDEYIRSVLDGMEACTAFWDAVKALRTRMSVGVGIK